MCVCVSPTKYTVSVFIFIVAQLSELQVTCASGNYTPILLRHRRQSSSSFVCANGETISSYDVCDGVKHCSDSSDETKDTCSRPTDCPSLSFECSYGACIDQNKRCDEKTDCVDGSDELNCPNNRNSVCGANRFECVDGQCVNQYDICDGQINCNDGSDETRSLCRDLKCPPNTFKCQYGACMDISVKCNKHKDCMDGSDELNCNGTGEEPIIVTRRPDPGEHCRLPDQPSHGYHVRLTNCAAGDQSAACRNVPGTAVISSWVLKYGCDNKYKLNSESPHSVCEHGVWTPSLRCYKLCPALKSVSTDLTCSYNGGRVSCDAPLRPGTKATSHCKQHYHHDSPPQDLVCQENGEWNDRLQKCAPNCGVSTPEGTVTPLIRHGNVTKRGEFPWLAAIYHQKSSRWDQVCGGTLITPHIVLTAAHCILVNGILKTFEEVKVGLGKYYRDYYKEEHNSVIADVREISYPPKYIGPADNYALDIALLDLVHSVQINTFVMPACVDWSANYVNPVSSVTIGNVAGWGTTENSVSSETILSTQLTYLDNVQCKERFYTDIRSIVNDKFCGASINGGQALQGDSGGGYTVVKNTQHFVLGVVSVKLKTGIEFSMFTELSNPQHREWINDKRRYFSDIHRDEL